MASKKPAATEPRAGNTLKDKLARIGVVREQDLVLHLPLRYEDHTHLCPLAALQPGQTWQVEGTVVNTEIQYRGRRQLVCLLQDGDAQLVLRFFHFYPSQQKALAAGKRVRAFGEVRDGHFGLEMVHPQFSRHRAGHATARAPDTGVSDDGGTRAGSAAQACAPGAGGRSRAAR